MFVCPDEDRAAAWRRRPLARIRPRHRPQCPQRPMHRGAPHTTLAMSARYLRCWQTATRAAPAKSCDGEAISGALAGSAVRYTSMNRHRRAAVRGGRWRLGALPWAAGVSVGTEMAGGRSAVGRTGGAASWRPPCASGWRWPKLYEVCHLSFMVTCPPDVHLPRPISASSLGGLARGQSLPRLRLRLTCQRSTRVPWRHPLMSRGVRR